MEQRAPIKARRIIRRYQYAVRKQNDMTSETNQIDDLDKQLVEASKLLRKLKGVVGALSANKDFNAVLTMVRQQEQRIQDLREENDRLKARNSELRDEQIDFRWALGEDIEAEELRDFLIDIGLEPCYLPTALSERMAIRDAIAAAMAVR